MTTVSTSGRGLNKLYPDARSALDGIVRDGMLLAVGGFGLCGIPEALIAALRDTLVDLVQTENPGVGVPRFAAMHVTRQRRALIHHLCHVCGKPTERRDRYLFPIHSGAMVTLVDVEKKENKR